MGFSGLAISATKFKPSAVTNLKASRRAGSEVLALIISAIP
jgi:hypothetical protein